MSAVSVAKAATLSLGAAVLGLVAYKLHKKSRRRPRPLVFVGPSGVGKGTLLAMLLQEFPGQFKKSVTHTTRKPREVAERQSPQR